MTAHTIAATVHGRYLHEDRGEKRLLAGFHGYAEDAETHLAALGEIDGANEWSIVSIQALHPFYTRDGKIVANWMTSLDRELAIADNLEYVRKVLAAIPRPETLVFTGFSQGATMAVRAAAWAAPCGGLIMLGGDIPPDVKASSAKLPPVLLARGTKDTWYTDEKFKNDLSYLRASATTVTECVFEGGHEWSDAFRAAAADFLKGLTR